MLPGVREVRLLPLAGVVVGEGVHSDDLVASPKEAIDQVRADEARATRDEVAAHADALNGRFWEPESVKLLPSMGRKSQLYPAGLRVSFSTPHLSSLRTSVVGCGRT